jgi:phage shock protein C
MDTVPTAPKRLRKSRDKKLAGVCGGIAEYFGIDPTLVRLIWALATFFSAILLGTLLYVVFAVVMPEPDQTPVG